MNKGGRRDFFATSFFLAGEMELPTNRDLAREREPAAELFRAEFLAQQKRDLDLLGAASKHRPTDRSVGSPQHEYAQRRRSRTARAVTGCRVWNGADMRDVRIVIIERLTGVTVRDEE